MTEHVITFLPENRKIKVKPKTTILAAALSTGIDITGSCGGKGNCGKCRVEVISTNPAPTVTEKELMSEDDLNNGFRLACEQKIENDMQVEIPIETRIGNQKILTTDKFSMDQNGSIPIETPPSQVPMIQKFYLELPKPTLEDNISDFERVRRGLGVVNENFNLDCIEISLSLLQKLPKALRKKGWKVTVTLYNLTETSEIIDIEPGNTTTSCYGAAFDIGTSTIVGYLVDLTNNQQLSAASTFNPQVYYGDDILTRISYGLENKRGPKQLQIGITQTMNKILDELVSNNDINKSNIYELTAVGNTCMHHLFFKLNLEGLATAPFTPSSTQTNNLKARELKLKLNPEGIIYSLPLVAGYMGSDAVAGALSSNIDTSDSVKLLIDLGTNGEIILGSSSRILGCSTAAGPAFEGGHIAHGVRAVEGAIENIRFTNNKTPKIEITTIANVQPIGITGSGLVDIVAELLKFGIIDPSGKFNLGQDQFRDRSVGSDDNPEFVIVDGKATQTGQPITISQKDIRELQLAKAAIYTGAKILMRELNIQPRDLSEVLIAGAFGNYVNQNSALAIKLLPEVPLDIIKPIGNAAGAGAELALVSRDERIRAIKIAAQIEYIELVDHQDFQEVYVDSMGF